MISYYKTVANRLIELDSITPGCWVSVVDPTAQERKMLIDTYGLDSDFLKSSLDEEESSRVEQEEDQTLIIVDTAVSEVDKDDTLVFYTMPLGIILTNHYVFTISFRENKIIDDVVSGRIRNIQTQFRTQFVLRLMMNITASFLVYLKQIDKTSSAMQRKLHGAMKNHELMQMLELEKSLIYFSTSLKSNDVTMNKILRGRVVKLYEEDQDLLEDVLIELKQAQEMASIYSGILSGVVDAFGSVISNNLNIVMWRLTMVTIILAIPTMVFSFYGMNTLDLPGAEHTWFTLLSLLLTAIVAFVLFKYKKK
ncbi:magnesium transporter CorA family protein [Ruminococcus sp.]|uniref:magnesium transporter CorA family protein n=1 Tax=Ruminococcus sp. TaxID=41978 RepID=UPI0039926138